MLHKPGVPEKEGRPQAAGEARGPVFPAMHADASAARSIPFRYTHFIHGCWTAAF
ncbi:mCG61597 [Mus musculus]|nr:mCG61597 [Mus musculus]